MHTICYFSSIISIIKLDITDFLKRFIILLKTPRRRGEYLFPVGNLVLIQYQAGSQIFWQCFDIISTVWKVKSLDKAHAHTHTTKTPTSLMYQCPIKKGFVPPDTALFIRNVNRKYWFRPLGNLFNYPVRSDSGFAHAHCCTTSEFPAWTNNSCRWTRVIYDYKKSLGLYNKGDFRWGDCCSVTFSIMKTL